MDDNLKCQLVVDAMSDQAVQVVPKLVSFLELTTTSDVALEAMASLIAVAPEKERAIFLAHLDRLTPKEH